MKSYSFKIFIALIILTGLASCSTEYGEFSEATKIALRDAGNKLLLSQKDSTSLILPIKALGANKYQLSFNTKLAIEPNVLVSVIDKSLNNIDLPENYIVEVLNCNDKEVAYSYQMSATEGNTIIPCLNRYLNKGCFLIEINFTDKSTSKHSLVEILLLLLIILLIIIVAFTYIKSYQGKLRNLALNYEVIGSFKFYPDQNKLIKKAEEITLSRKECELLTLFAQRPNEIIKRDELTKRVWEDNGVIVGRSLDTYISKLRKILQKDSSIKLTNFHGVGYKLEIL